MSLSLDYTTMNSLRAITRTVSNCKTVRQVETSSREESQALFVGNSQSSERGPDAVYEVEQHCPRLFFWRVSRRNTGRGDGVRWSAQCNAYRHKILEVVKTCLVLSLFL